LKLRMKAFTVCTTSVPKTPKPLQGLKLNASIFHGN